MRLRFLLTAAALLSTSLIARADNYTNFTLTSSYQNGGDGTLVLDTTTDSFTSADLTASGFPTSSEDATLQTIAQQSSGNGAYYIVVEDTGAYVVGLTLPVATLADYDGSAICVEDSSAASCPSGPTVYDAQDTDFTGVSGTLEPAAAITATP